MANAMMVLNPYWSGGTWVFDDPATGLVREPFVSGIPEMINALTRDIPNARQGFRLLFSESPFPGHQAVFDLSHEEFGGAWYRCREPLPEMEGWLCPALFKYFDKPPRAIYARAERMEAPETR